MRCRGGRGQNNHGRLKKCSALPCPASIPITQGRLEQPLICLTGGREDIKAERGHDRVNFRSTRDARVACLSAIPDLCPLSTANATNTRGMAITKSLWGSVASHGETSGTCSTEN